MFNTSLKDGSEAVASRVARVAPEVCLDKAEGLVSVLPDGFLADSEEETYKKIKI